MTGVASENKIMSTKPKKERNGLIELFRFLFALNVVKSHSLFFVQGNYFGPGRVSVEFFFVLSGFLFFSFLERNKNAPLKKSLPLLIKSKLGPIAVPLIIGIASNIVYNIVSGELSGIWGYLWYVHVMFAEMIILLLLRKLIKNDNAFLITIAVITVIALGLKFFGPFYSWGFIRGASSIPVGILIAKLPRLRLKKQWLIWFPLSLVFALCFVIVCFGLGNVEWFGFRIPELILDNLLYPALIYLTFSLNVRCKFFTYLGALSFGLYAFQCPADLLRLLGVSNLGLLFGFIVLATLIDDTAKRFFRRLADRQ